MNTKTAVVSEQQPILGGKALILRVPVSGDVWQFRMWVPEERKYVRKTLNTRDLKTAIERAETLYLQLYSDLAAGKRLFGITLKELVAEYLKWRADDVKAATITQGRLGTLTAHLKHLLAYKGAETKLNELNRTSLYDYAQYRRTHDEAELATIRNEQTTLNHLMRFAYRRGYAAFDAFDFAALKIREASRRDTFTLQEYDDLVRFLRSYVSKKSCVNEQQRLQRLMIRDCILIASNTMLRVGELWQLKWSDITGYSQHKNDNGHDVVLVALKVRAETAKTRKSRLITVRGGEYFQRLHERAIFKGKSDFIFCGETGNKRVPRRVWYETWAELMSSIGIDHQERNLTWYSLRHFGITCRLRAGASIFDIAKIAGNSVTDIEKHYGHFDQEMAKAVALKNFTISKDGINELR